MAFGFPAYHTETYSGVASRLSCAPAAKRAFAALSWPIRGETSDTVVASRGVNMWSWGETVSIHFGSDNSCSVTSKCAVPFQCCDWGRNRRNVEEFARTLKQYV